MTAYAFSAIVQAFGVALAKVNGSESVAPESTGEKPHETHAEVHNAERLRHYDM